MFRNRTTMFSEDQTGELPCLSILEQKDAVPQLISFERAVRAHMADQDYRDARASLRHYLWSELGKEPSGTIAEAVEALSDKNRRLPEVAPVLLRSLAVNQLLPTGPGTQLDRSIVKIVEEGLPKLCEY